MKILIKKFFGLFWLFFEFFENFEKKFFGLFPHEIFFGNFFQQKCHSEKIFRPILNLIENINFRENLRGRTLLRFEIAQHYLGAFETSKKF